MKYPKLYIKKSKEKALENRHSWIFSGAIAKADSTKEGEIVEIRRSSDGKLAAYAFYTGGPSIVAKIFLHTNEETDVESGLFWKQKIINAYQIRQLTRQKTNGYRLIFAEGDFFPGLIIDVYKETAVIQTYNSGIDKVANFVFDQLKELGFNHLFIKKVHEHSNLKTGWLSGSPSEETIIEEYGLKFKVDIEQGQKTGFYIDQRENRNILGKYAHNRTVLNLFSYTGGFSLYALKAGAKRVDSVDLSERAINIAKQNAAINNLEENHNGIVANCFDYLKEMPQDFYDLIIIDPPAFAKTQSAVKQASRGYKELNLKAMKKIKSNGLIFTFSCSQRIDKELFKKIVFSAAADAKRNVRILGYLSQGEDHPINIFHPESEYLKGLILHVE